jgi:hypothetical protein
MKTQLLAALALAAAFPAGLLAQGHTFRFDHVASGSAANSALSGGVTVEPAFYAPSLDGDGNDIPGTEAWRTDTFAPAVTVDNPMTFDRGEAPSPSNALNALFQPVMLLFPTPEFVGLFRVTLDGDEFGSIVPIEFYDSFETLIWSTTVDQSVSYLMVNETPGVAGVSKIVLPGGAFYDNIQIEAVPEADTQMLMLAGSLLLMGGLWMHRRKA